TALGARLAPVAEVAWGWGPLGAFGRVFVLAPVGTLLHIREPPLQSGTEIDRFVRATGTPSVLGPNTATMVSRSQRQTTGSPLFLHLPAHQNLLRLSCFRSRLPSCCDCESGNKRRVRSPDSRCGRADSWWHPGNHLRKRLLVKGR